MQILLADRHPIARDGIKALLEELESDVKVIETGTFEGVLSQVSNVDGLDLIIVDPEVSGMNGLAGLDTMRERYPDVPVVVFSDSYHRDYVVNALERGARGFIPKCTIGKVILKALQLVLSGEKYIPSIILSLPDSDAIGGVGFGTRRTCAENPLGRLTSRERDVLGLLTRGCTSNEIANNLEVKTGTVSVHLKSIYRKLGVANRIQAARIALGVG